MGVFVAEQRGVGLVSRAKGGGAGKYIYSSIARERQRIESNW